MNAIWNKSKNILAAVGLALVLLAVMFVLSGPATPVQAVSGGEPGTGSMVNWRTVTFAAGDTGITETTYFVPSGSTDGYLMQGWYKGDVFVTADLVTTTNIITITPQVSVDLSNWVDLQYESEGWVLPLDFSETITSTGSEMTSTHSFASSAAERVSEDVTYQVVISADGSDYVVVPMRGNYLRIKAEVDSSSTAVTPTVTVVFKNDGGR
jgi:hypothetical protein